MNVSIHRNVWTFFVALVCACGSTGLSDGDQELLQAARRGATVEITRSLEAGASIEAADEEGKTALMLAAEGGHAEAMRVLIEAGANSVACGNPTGWGSYQCWTVIGRAIGSSNPEAVRVALQVWATLPSGWWKHDPGVTRAILSHCLERGSCRLDDFLSDIVHNDEMVARPVPKLGPAGIDEITASIEIRLKL